MSDNIDPSLATDFTMFDVAGTGHLVADCENDIAYTIGLKSMRIGIPNRVQFQETYQWQGDDTSNSRRIDPYHSAKDCCPTSHLHPFPNELLFEGVRDKAYMRVGIISGDDPKKHRKKRLGSAINADAEVLDLDEFAMPVVVARERSIPNACRLYVCAREASGKRYLKKIDLSTAAIFFFPEFWAGPELPDPKISKRREETIKYNIKYHCAEIKDKGFGGGSSAAREAVYSQLENQCEEEQSRIIQEAYPISAFSPMTDGSVKHESTFYPSSTQDTCDEKAVHHAPCSSGLGAASTWAQTFFEYHQELKLKDAERLIDELFEHVHPDLAEVDPEVVMTVHSIVAANEPLQQCLAYQALAFFLGASHLLLSGNLAEDYETKYRIVVDCIGLAMLHCNLSPSRLY